MVSRENDRGTALIKLLCKLMSKYIQDVLFSLIEKDVFAVFKRFALDTISFFADNTIQYSQIMQLLHNY
jgi:hypothetical protein